MNKKVLSAILFSALFAGTGTFTSCIDNDEPAGIEELRGAKAELIRAKVAVETANAAFRLAQAEHEKAEAAIDLAEAKIKEATAQLEQAKAERQEIENEAARVELDNKIAELEIAMEEALADHEKNMLIKQQSLAEAKRNYEIALKQIAIAEALMSENQKETLKTLKGNVSWWLTEVERLEHDVEKQQDVVYDAAKYIAADTAYEIAQAEADLNLEKGLLEANAEAIAKYKKYLDLDSTATESTWRTEIAEIEAEVGEYDKKVAELQLELVKAIESEETKTLETAVETAKAAKAELKAPKVAEELAYTYKYWAGVQDKKIVAADEDTDAETAAIAIAGADFMEAEEYGAGIAALKKEIASYTTEKQYWLDSIADMAGSAATKAEKDAKDLKDKWSKALTEYAAAQNATPLSKNAIFKAGEKATDPDTGAAVVYTESVIAADAKKQSGAYTEAEYNEAILLAKQKFADALVTWYNTLPAAQVTFRTITLGTEVDGETIYASKTAKEWLSDASLKHKNLDKLYAYFNGKMDALWNVGAKAEEKNTNGSVKTATTGAFATWTDKADLVAAKGLALQKASENAFGAASNYATNAPADAEDWYLHKEPTLEDFKYVFNNVTTASAGQYGQYGKLGAYGTWMLSKDDEIEFVANNYKAIIADYEAAIEYWTAAVDEIKETLTAFNAEVKVASEAVTAAQKALNDHMKAITSEYDNEIAVLKEKKNSLNAVKWALIRVVDVYLADSYTGEEDFIDFLEGELEDAEEQVALLEYNVAVAEADLKAVMEGKFDAAHKLAKEQEKLAKLEEDLAEAVKGLEKAIADLATAEEIWAE